MAGSIIFCGQTTNLSSVKQNAAMAATGFHGLGVGAGSTIATLMRNDVACFEAAFAAGTLGVYTVPMNWHFKSHEIAHILQDSGAKVVIAHADLLWRVRDAIPDDVIVIIAKTPSPVKEHYGIADATAALHGEFRVWDDWIRRFEPWQGPPSPPVGAMIYTAGTTGAPKGVKRQLPTPEMAAAVTRITDQMFDISPGKPARTIVTGPMYHSAPHNWAITSAKADSLIVLQVHFDPEELLALIERHRITHLHMVPTMFWRLLKLPESVRSKYDLSSLKFVVHAAAPCPAEVKQAIIKWWGPIVHEYFGASETGPIAFCRPRDAAHKPGTVGKLVEGATLTVRDESGAPLGPNEIGELYVRQTLFPDFDYYGLSEKRAEIEIDGQITVGDMGYVDEDGFLFLCDRASDMVISGGVNIYPAEIEKTLISMSGIEDCAVFGIPDPEFGESLCAIVVTDPEKIVTPEEIITWLKDKLANYKLPRRIEFRDSLPREDSGKIFKKALREPFWAGTGRQV